jgi:hypothetical protein
MQVEGEAIISVMSMGVWLFLPVMCSVYCALVIQGVTPDRPSMQPPKKEWWVEGKKEGQAVRRTGSSTGRLGMAVGP